MPLGRPLRSNALATISSGERRSAGVPAAGSAKASTPMVKASAARRGSGPANAAAWTWTGVALAVSSPVKAARIGSAHPGAHRAGRFSRAPRGVAAPCVQVQSAARGLDRDGVELAVCTRIGRTEPNQVIRVALPENRGHGRIRTVGVHDRAAAGAVRQHPQRALLLEMVVGGRDDRGGGLRAAKGRAGPAGGADVGQARRVERVNRQIGTVHGAEHRLARVVQAIVAPDVVAGAAGRPRRLQDQVAADEEQHFAPAG